VARREYQTVPDELLDVADAAASYFENAGHRVTAERSELGYPYTPTLVCKRASMTTIVEVDNKVRPGRVDDWLSYGRSCTKDTRVALCLPSSTIVTAPQHAELQSKGAGLYTVLPAGVIESIPPQDLGINLQLPRLSGTLRGLLGSAYDQFKRSQWREGFADACQVLEVESRAYLKRGSKQGRIQVIRKAGAVVLTSKVIDKMTLGGLATAFASIQTQNHADAIIGRSLAAINRDRVGVSHFKGKANVEQRLRRNVGQHMWTIVGALKVLR
jgi:hypothetical protein